MTLEEQIQQLHTTYCELSGLDILCSMNRRFFWEQFLARGFTLDDLTLVLRNLRRQVKDGWRKTGCMGFTRLLGDLDSFEELLAEFRALQRKPAYPTGRAAVLRDTHRPDEPAQSQAQDAATTLERSKLAQRLNEWKSKQGW